MDHGLECWTKTTGDAASSFAANLSTRRTRIWSSKFVFDRQWYLRLIEGNLQLCCRSRILADFCKVGRSEK